MSDPFQDAHRAVQRKADKDRAAQEIVARDQRIDEMTKRRNAPKVEKPYIFSGPFWK